MSSSDEYQPDNSTNPSCWDNDVYDNFLADRFYLDSDQGTTVYQLFTPQETTAAKDVNPTVKKSDKSIDVNNLPLNLFDHDEARVGDSPSLSPYDVTLDMHVSADDALPAPLPAGTSTQPFQLYIPLGDGTLYQLLTEDSDGPHNPAKEIEIHHVVDNKSHQITKMKNHHSAVQATLVGQDDESALVKIKHFTVKFDSPGPVKSSSDD